MYVIRRFNGAIARRWIPTLGLGSGRAVIAIQTAGIAADFARAGLLTLLAMVALDPLAEAMVGLWSLDARRVSVHVIAATNRALAQDVAERRFRALGVRLERGAPVKGWLEAGVLSDSGDAAATLMQWRELGTPRALFWLTAEVGAAWAGSRLAQSLD